MPLPAGTRLASVTAFAERYMTEENWEIVEKLEAFAKARGHSMLELAFCLACWRGRRWRASSPAPPGRAGRAELAAAAWELSPEDLAEIDRLTAKQ